MSDSLGFLVQEDKDNGASITVDETTVEIEASDFAGSYFNPWQSARHVFRGKDRIAFLRFCADVVKRFPVPDEVD